MSTKLRKASLSATLVQIRFARRDREGISVASLSQALHDGTVNYDHTSVVIDTGNFRSLVAGLFQTRQTPNAKTLYVDDNRIPAGFYFVHRKSRHRIHAFLLESETPRTIDTDLNTFVCKSGELHLIITPLGPAVTRKKSTIKAAVTNVRETAMGRYFPVAAPAPSADASDLGDASASFRTLQAHLPVETLPPMFAVCGVPLLLPVPPGEVIAHTLRAVARLGHLQCKMDDNVELWYTATSDGGVDAFVVRFESRNVVYTIVIQPQSANAVRLHEAPVDPSAASGQPDGGEVPQPVTFEQLQCALGLLFSLVQVCENADTTDEMASEALENTLRVLKERGFDDLHDELETEVMMYEADGYSSTASSRDSTHNQVSQECSGEAMVESSHEGGELGHVYQEYDHVERDAPYVLEDTACRAMPDPSAVPAQSHNRNAQTSADLKKTQQCVEQLTEELRQAREEIERLKMSQQQLHLKPDEASLMLPELGSTPSPVDAETLIRLRAVLNSDLVMPRFPDAPSEIDSDVLSVLLTTCDAITTTRGEALFQLVSEALTLVQMKASGGCLPYLVSLREHVLALLRVLQGKPDLDHIVESSRERWQALAAKLDEEKRAIAEYNQPTVACIKAKKTSRELQLLLAAQVVDLLDQSREDITVLCKEWVPENLQQLRSNVEAVGNDFVLRCKHEAEEQRLFARQQQTRLEQNKAACDKLFNAKHGQLQSSCSVAEPLTSVQAESNRLDRTPALYALQSARVTVDQEYAENAMRLQAFIKARECETKVAVACHTLITVSIGRVQQLYTSAMQKLQEANNSWRADFLLHSGIQLGVLREERAHRNTRLHFLEDRVPAADWATQDLFASPQDLFLAMQALKKCQEEAAIATQQLADIDAQIAAVEANRNAVETVQAEMVKLASTLDEWLRPQTSAVFAKPASHGAMDFSIAAPPGISSKIFDDVLAKIQDIPLRVRRELMPTFQHLLSQADGQSTQVATLQSLIAADMALSK